MESLILSLSETWHDLSTHGREVVLAALVLASVLIWIRIGRLSRKLDQLLRRR